MQEVSSSENPFEQITAGLNPEQLRAVEALDGPLLILAGAGSGKTRVITHRIANLIATGRAAPHEILAVTFTNKAASEMQHRVFELLQGLGIRLETGLWISTFHSFCVRLLRHHAEMLEYKKSFIIYDDSDQLSLIKSILKELNLDDKIFPPKVFKSQINNAKMQGLTIEKIKVSPQKYFDHKSLQVFELYEARLKQLNAFDFGDLLLKAVQLFEMYPDLLEQYQQHFKYIMVDEYQDTNQIQYELVQSLSRGHHNLCVVGDEDQSIYSWRGADIRNILNFKVDFPEAQIIKLEENYRSTQTIVEAASLVIKNNQQRNDKTLFTQNAKGDPIHIRHEQDEYEEAKWVVRSISEVLASGEYAPSEVAIFYRTNAQSRVLEEQLRMRSLPYKIVGGVRFYERLEIKDVLYYFRLVINPNDDFSLQRVINAPARGIGKTTLEKIEQVARAQSVPFVRAIEMAIEAKAVNSGTAEKLRGFLRLLDKLREQQKTMTLLDFYQALLDETQYLVKLKLDQSPESDARIDNLEEFGNAIAKFSQENAEPTLDKFLEEMMLASDQDSLKEQQQAITMMTLHVSKGLEYPIVFIVGLEEGLFPSLPKETPVDEDELEEERRLFYVGMTRARQKLFLSGAMSRKVWGQEQRYELSRFIEEIPETHKVFTAARPRGGGFLSRYGSSASFGSSYGSGPGSGLVRASGSAGSGQFSSGAVVRRAGSSPARQDGVDQPFPDYDTVLPRFEKGVKVKHPNFGVGTILEVEGAGDQEKVSVVFVDRSVRRFVTKYARLESV